MKRKGFIYENLIDKNKIKEAFYDVSKGKTKRLTVRKFEKDLDNKIDLIYNLLKNENYEFSQGRVKIIKEYNKERTITVPRFIDQVVQRLIFNEINDDLIKGMYKWSCGSIKGRGGLYAKKYIEPKIRSGKYKYCLKLDIKKYFHNIDCDILTKQLSRKYKDPKLLKLFKRLLNAGNNNSNKGLPIGFYSSQILSNFYLNVLDFYIKQELKVEVYVRYVDDMIILHNNKRELHKIKDKIIEFLKYELKLETNKKEQIFPIKSRCVDFVGYKMGVNQTRIRKRNLKLLKRNARKIALNKYTIHTCRVFMNYLSWLKHIYHKSFINTFREQIKIARMYISKYDKRRNKNEILKRSNRQPRFYINYN